ncbi:MAG: TraR/DksA C4-type zinc finger protein [Candidatus Cloacimonadota bacterium]|nr:TraR/DksA C4-type zinc finger protein [Candidatus Cloacimonadota bacterium]
MSEKKLSDKKLKKYETILLQEKQQTQKIIDTINEIQKKGTKNGSGDLSSYSIHQADLGSDTDEAERRVYILNKELQNLKYINEALKRIYDKSYGICVICGDYIPEKRLKVIPYAKYCIACKEKEEKRKRRR